jgi:hypothetical protein
MSNAYNNVVAALSADAELRDKVMAASTPKERAALLTAAGLELPTAEEIEEAKLAGIPGGAATSLGTGTQPSAAFAAACGP